MMSSNMLVEVEFFFDFFPGNNVAFLDCFQAFLDGFDGFGVAENFFSGVEFFNILLAHDDGFDLAFDGDVSAAREVGGLVDEVRELGADLADGENVGVHMIKLFECDRVNSDRADSLE